ncbi:beta strand repeat-containing protein, partial [Pseudacidovorax intermedius]
VDAASGDVAVTAGIDIVDGDLTEDANADITANRLRLTAAQSDAAGGIGFGSVLNALETQVATLTASAGTRGLFLAERDAVAIDSVTVNVRLVLADGTAAGSTTSTAQEDLTATGSGALVLRAGGDITVGGTAATNGVTSAGGNVLLESTGGALVLNTAVSAAGGHVSVRAATRIDAVAGIATSGSGTLEVVAANGALTQSATSAFTSGSGDIRLQATGNVTLARVSTTGNLSVDANAGSILDADTAANERVLNLSANGLRLMAAGSVGTAANALEIDATTLAAYAGTTGVFLLESNGLTVGTVANAIRQVGADGSVGAALATGGSRVDVAGNLSDIVTGASAHVVLQSTTGDLVLNDGGNADGVAIRAGNVDGTSGNVLVEALAGAVTGNADIRSAGTSGANDGGWVTVKGSTGVRFTGAAGITTGILGAVNVESAAGSIVQASGNAITAGGSVRLVAAQDVSVGVITVTSSGGSVSITASAGSILDADGTAGESALNITTGTASGSLRLKAGAAIGAAGNLLETRTVNLSALAGNGGLFLAERDGVNVTTVSVAVQAVTATGALAAASLSTDAGQSDLRTAGGDGSIVLTNAAGTLTLTDGASGATDGVAVSANGRGNVLLQSAGAIALADNADVLSGSGNISILATGALSLAAGADVRT